jgi:predicted TIM-barrel fold metal-dependent hydrolase
MRIAGIMMSAAAASLVISVHSMMAGDALRPADKAAANPAAEISEADKKPVSIPKDLNIYLLIGDSNMAGTAPLPDDAGGVIDRCYLLNGSNQWERACMQKLGPGYSFARKMLAGNKDISIGLVVNASGDSKIEEWLGKSQLYWGASLKTALQSGTMQGVLWIHGGGATNAPEAYIEGLKSIISNIRTDFIDSAIPFVAGQIYGNKALNDHIAGLPKSGKVIGFASSEGLTSDDGRTFDARSQMILGERCAAEMIAVSKTRAAATSKPPTDLLLIDPHVHAMSVTSNGLEAVARWMAERNVERCIVSPLAHKGSRPQNEAENQAMLANFQKYKGRIYRMCLIEPQEVETVDQAVVILKKEMADGAIAFGEHYGVGMMFDDPKNLRLYEACEKVGLPVMFHIDQNKNMVEPGMQRVDRVLKMFPKCKLIAHAYWWRQLKDADRQLQEHPNLYADMSGAVVPNVLNRDIKYAREFLIRNQDKIMWATDEGWWSFGGKEKQMNRHYTFLEELDLPKDVRYKLYRGNAEKLFGFKEMDKK